MRKIPFIIIMIAIVLGVNTLTAGAQNSNAAGNANIEFDLGSMQSYFTPRVVTPQEVLSKLMGIFFTILGLVTVVIIIIGGYKWLIAKNNNEKIKKAKRLVKNGIIGLLIIVCLYFISQLAIFILMRE